MNKKNTYLILAIVIIFIIAIILVTGLGEKPAQTPGPTTLAPEETAPQTSEEVGGIAQEAVNVQDLSLCQQIRDEKDKEWCEKNVVIAEASLKRDSGICEKLEKGADKLECQDNVTITKALDAKDVSICQQLNDTSRIEGCQGYITSAE